MSAQRGSRGRDPVRNATFVPNDLIERPDVSDAAVRMWLRVWSRPEGWDFLMRDLDAACGYAHGKAEACRRELIAAGYLVRERTAGGAWHFEFVWPASPEPVKTTRRKSGDGPETAEAGDHPPKIGGTIPRKSAHILKTNTPAVAAAASAAGGGDRRGKRDVDNITAEAEPEPVVVEEVVVEDVVPDDPERASKARMLDLACEAFPEMRHKWAHARRALEGAEKGSAPASAAGQGGSTWPGGEAGQVVA